MSIDNSGPIICLDTRSVSSRAAWEQVHAQKLDLVFRSYTLEDMLKSGLLYGNLLISVTIIVIKEIVKIFRIIFCLFQRLVACRSVLIKLVLVP